MGDALDECDQKSRRRKLLSLFHRMGDDDINLFITSRQHLEDIQDSLPHSAKVKIRANRADKPVISNKKLMRTHQRSAL